MFLMLNENNKTLHFSIASPPFSKAEKEKQKTRIVFTQYTLLLAENKKRQ